MRITGLDHVQLAMPPEGEEEARAFYGGLLGLDERAKPTALSGRGGCWFHGAGCEIHLGVEDDFRAARKAHAAFVVADLAHARSTLEAAGVALRDAEAVEGRARFFCADPFGNRLEFIAPRGDGW